MWRGAGGATAVYEDHGIQGTGASRARKSRPRRPEGALRRRPNGDPLPRRSVTAGVARRPHDPVVFTGGLRACARREQIRTTGQHRRLPGGLEAGGYRVADRPGTPYRITYCVIGNRPSPAERVLVDSASSPVIMYTCRRRPVWADVSTGGCRHLIRIRCCRESAASVWYFGHFGRRVSAA